MFNNLSQRTLCVLAGCIWLLAGLNLLFLGEKFLIESIQGTTGLNLPLLESLSSLTESTKLGAVFLAGIGALIGFLKGSTVLRKAAHREVRRIHALNAPVSLWQLYSVKGVIVLGIMLCLGASLRFLNIPLDIRGTIDVAIGVALILGSYHFLRPQAVAASHS